MRGPLLSGAVGSPVTLRRLAQVVKGCPPTVVMGSAWLGLALASEVSVLAMLPADALGAARRRRRRRGSGAPPSVFLLAGAALPLASGTAGSLVVTDLAELEPTTLAAFLLELALLVRPGGILVGLDRTRDAAVEARLAGALLSAGYLGIAQHRPREAALLTQGHPPPPAVQSVLAEAVRSAATGTTRPDENAARSSLALMGPSQGPNPTIAVKAKSRRPV
jgi:hypothetical protein